MCKRKRRTNEILEASRYYIKKTYVTAKYSLSLKTKNKRQQYEITAYFYD